MNGVNSNPLTDQIEFIHKNIKLTQQFELEDIYKLAILENGEDGGFGEIESIVLFSFIISNKPKKIIQIGCGVSTSTYNFKGSQEK